MFHLCSFGHDLLSPVAGRAGLRRALRFLLAARRRWPSGRFAVRGPVELVCLADCHGLTYGYGLGLRSLSFEWFAPDGCCAAMVELWPRWSGR